MSLALGLYPKYTEARESLSTDFTRLWIEPFKGVKQRLEMLRLWKRFGCKKELSELKTRRGSLSDGISGPEGQNYAEILHPSCWQAGSMSRGNVRREGHQDRPNPQYE